MKARLDAPDTLLLAFRIDTGSGRVRWLTPDEVASGGLRVEDKRGRKLPYGQPAGSKVTVGHGRLVMYAGRQLLTMDIAQGLTWMAPARRFTWNHNATPETGDASPEDAFYVATIQQTWRLGAAGLEWRFSPHSTIAAGASAIGVCLAGRGDNALTFRGRVYVSSDVEHVLRTGRLPWQEAWD